MASLLKGLESSNKSLFHIIKSSSTVEGARERIYNYIFRLEKKLEKNPKVYTLERANIKECVWVLRSLISPINEKKTKFSTLSLLRDSIQKKSTKVSECFLTEFLHLFKGLLGNSHIYSQDVPGFVGLKGKKAAIYRSDFLDDLSESYEKGIKKFKTGLDKSVIKTREETKKKILKAFKGTEKDWHNWEWQKNKVIKQAKVLSKLLPISKEHDKAIKIAEKNRIPFGITPFYLSLMDQSGRDSAIQAQVIPPLFYMENMAAHKGDREYTCDFMLEHDTSPVELVTRRYPLIAILKPFDTCPQICVYCQRNWEIEEVLSENALASNNDLNAALGWFKAHPSIKEILITGGDPGILDNEALNHLLGEIASIPHIERIRMATRVPVTLPMRIDDEWLDVLEKYHEPGKREIYVVTHVEHPYEVNPDMLKAVQKIKKRGLNVYNQQVMTPYNTRRWESVALRRALKTIGIDPYYSFYPKGKKEARDYLVPVARVLQERKEEARLTPGSSRTDEPVFNVPGLGKNHLRSWQDHELIGITSEGSRIYEFHPWEKNLTHANTYVYHDIPIQAYLDKLKQLGENPKDYSTIWWYY